MSDDLERRTRPISFMVMPGQLVTWCPPGLAWERHRNLGDLRAIPSRPPRRARATGRRESSRSSLPSAMRPMPSPANRQSEMR
jgi:hypothetical protein